MLRENSEGCEVCRFFSENIERTFMGQKKKFRLPYCSLRRILVKRSPFWTYCKNCLSNEDQPVGNVYFGGGIYPPGKKIWLKAKDQARLLMEQATLASFCRDKLPLSDPKLGSKLTYPNLPLCVIDTVLSIGMSYKHTKRLVAKFIDRFCKDTESVHEKGERQIENVKNLTIRDLVDIFHQNGIEHMAKEIMSRHRTNSKKEILRAEVVLNFSHALLDFGIDTLSDVEKAIGNPTFEAAIKEIIGPKNGLSLNHFYIPVGAGDYVKPDRMIQWFVRNLIGRNVKGDYCHQLLFGACLILAADYPDLNAGVLDHLIWRYESDRQS